MHCIGGGGGCCHEDERAAVSPPTASGGCGRQEECTTLAEAIAAVSPHTASGGCGQEEKCTVLAEAIAAFFLSQGCFAAAVIRKSAQRWRRRRTAPSRSRRPACPAPGPAAAASGAAAPAPGRQQHLLHLLSDVAEHTCMCDLTGSLHETVNVSCGTVNGHVSHTDAFGTLARRRTSIGSSATDWPMSLMSARTLSSRIAFSATRSFTCVRLCSRSAPTSVSSIEAAVPLDRRRSCMRTHAYSVHVCAPRQHKSGTACMVLRINLRLRHRSFMCINFCAPRPKTCSPASMPP